MTYELIRQVEVFSKGYDEDESRTEEQFVHYHVVHDTEKDEFGEFVVSCTENQDYNYSVSFKTLMKFNDIDLEDIKKVFLKVTNNES
jgi:hypothetical protein